jgi:hypothetical protein
MTIQAIFLTTKTAAEVALVKFSQTAISAIYKYLDEPQADTKWV